MAYSAREIQDIKNANNLPDICIPINTKNGGVVFVNSADTNLINEYLTGIKTGDEPAPGGVCLRVLPKVETTGTPGPVRPTSSTPPTVVRSVPTEVGTQIKIIISPEQLPRQTKNVAYKFNVNAKPIEINISQPLIQTANKFLRDILNVYIDEERELKTLVNYGEDRQSIALAYRNGPVDINGIETIQLKLLQPVPDEITVGTPVFLSREVAKTVIDKVRVRFTPEIDATPYLRPRNLKARSNLDTGRVLNNVTLNKLSLQSGSVGTSDQYKNISFEDQIFRQWYSYDFNSSELNIDFTNYDNFVFYSSAAMRLLAFRQKLRQIEQLENSRKQILTQYTANTASAGFIYIQEKSAEYSVEKENIIRSFDRYEQYLFFTPSGSTSAYSASFDYVDGGLEYNQPGYWPKSGSDLYPVDSDVAKNWFDLQLGIAQRFDEFNENNLINTIPSHIREDDNNGAYITFVSMIGQVFDNIKLYVDQYPNIYSRNLNPNEELSKDLIGDIAESLGFVLPTVDSVYNLADNILGTQDAVPRRDLAVEIYKRLLHNLPFFAKAKGTKTALQALLNTFGITEQLLSVKEFGTPTTSSYKVVTEYTTGLDFDETKTSYITIPISASGRTCNVLQFNCTIAQNKNMTVINGDEKWAINVTRHSSNETLGRFEITSGSSNVVIASSSYHPIFGDELLNIAIKTSENTSSFHFIQTDADEILFNEKIVTTNKFPSLWSSTNNVYMGGSGSLVTARYDGTLDEVRLWGKPITDDNILITAFNPSSNAGDLYTDAADYLYGQLSFNKIYNSLLTSSLIPNESPYKNKLVAPSLETFVTYNILEQDFIRYTRTVKRDVLIAGTNSHITNKITVAPSPKFINYTNGLRLYRTKSIIDIPSKKLIRGSNKIVLAMTPSDIVNDNIISNFGLENINEILGVPTDLYKKFDKSLTVLQQYYQQYYYVNVNSNTFIRVMSDVSSVLNQVLDYFIPSRASLWKGVLVDNNILQRVKFPLLKKMRVYGDGTRKTLDAPGALTGSSSDYEATFNLNAPLTNEPAVDVQGGYNQYVADVDYRNNVPFGELKIVTSSITVNTGDQILGTYETIKTQHRLENTDQLPEDAHIDSKLTNLNKINYNNKNGGSAGAEPYNRLYTRKLFDTEITAQRDGGNTSLYIPALYEIPPSADFRDFGVYTFFNSDEGIYFFNEIKLRPVYSSPLNATWNFTAQTFGTTITSWSYGERYNKFDVVYQDISKNDLRAWGLPTESAVNAGNKRYYVFKTRPVYVEPTTGERYYSGSVPSYTPPSLDNENWDVLRFQPIQVRIPKRVVFDTYRISDPALNNFKTTTISIDRNINIPNRFVDTFEIKSLPAYEKISGEVLMHNITTLLAAQATSGKIRLRLYRTQDARDLDINRSIEDRPTGAHGVLLDAVLENNNIAEVSNPIPTLVSGDLPTNGKVYYTVDNLEAVNKVNIIVFLYYFAIQIQPRIPLGYLRKHYRFFRDNSTATKRRNYLGCKNTLETTVDGLPPIQVFVGAGTEIKVAPSTLNQEIVTGGGGTLNVT